ncbi:MAG TPA: rhomboid family intramembrane serine protease [Polyangia bacterium]
MTRNDASDPDLSPGPGLGLGQETVLRATANPTLVGDWALVLAAADIWYRLDEREGRFVLSVAADDMPAAAAALTAFDAETPVKPAPPAPDAGASALGALSALGLGAMYYVAGSADGHSRWVQAGAAVAERILAGEWWRAITALTLHADILHLAGNVVACLIFVSAVGRWLGGGLGALTILMTAAGANLLTAAVHRTAFSSLGASTATFAALGLCAGLQVVRRLRGEMRRAYAWVPLGAGLGLYAMLGVGPGADTYAHLFGLGLGAIVGSCAALGNVRAPRTTVQVLLGATALGAVVSAWALALR